MFFKNILPCTCWIFLVLLVDIGGGEEMRKYPHMCSTSLGAKGGGAVIRNGGGGGGGEEGRGSLGVLHYALSLIQTLLARTYQFGAPMLL